MKSQAYIISNGKLIASVQTDLRGGTEVIFSYHRCEEAINADREYNLVSARYGHISRAKKWDRVDCYAGGTEINPGEFYLNGE